MFDDENSFMVFFTSVNDFSKIVLIKSKSECDDNNSKIAFVDANHELKISEIEISKLRAQKEH